MAHDLTDPSRFGYGRETLSFAFAGRSWRLAAIDGFERNVATVYRTLNGRDTGRDPGDWMPMFGVAWPGMVSLAERVAAASVDGLHVLELGCGLGLPSLVAAAGGAHVLATDNHPHAGAFLAANARHNGVALTYRDLDWRDDRVDLGRPTFDRVLASDLLYSPELAPLVARTIARFLDRDGEAWLVDPGRLALGAFEDEVRRLGLRMDIEALAEGDGELFGLTLRW